VTATHDVVTPSRGPERPLIGRSGFFDTKARITITLPAEIDHQLLRLAAERTPGVNPIARDWIIENLDEAGRVRGIKPLNLGAEHIAYPVPSHP
jgi:hypothetical protein